MKYNKGFDFWDKYRRDCNCGSLAFNLDEWYHPGDLKGNYEDFLAEDFLLGLDDDFDDDEIADALANFYLDLLVEDFEDEISEPSLEEPEVVPNGYELIAFRAGAYSWDQGEWGFSFDYDFHFKVLREGQWLEKLGGGSVFPTSLSDWNGGSMYYNSHTFYFIHRIACENLTNS